MNTDTLARGRCLDTAADQVLSDVRRRLRDAGHRVLRQVSCEYSNGAVVLRGRVPSYYVKQIAQSVLMASPIVDQVVNLLVVSDERRETGEEEPPLHGRIAGRGHSAADSA